MWGNVFWIILVSCWGLGGCQPSSGSTIVTILPEKDKLEYNDGETVTFSCLVNGSIQRSKHLYWYQQFTGGKVIKFLERPVLHKKFSKMHNGSSIFCAFQEEGSPKQYSRTIELFMVPTTHTSMTLTTNSVVRTTTTDPSKVDKVDNALTPGNASSTVGTTKSTAPTTESSKVEKGVAVVTILPEKDKLEYENGETVVFTCLVNGSIQRNKDLYWYQKFPGGREIKFMERPVLYKKFSNMHNGSLIFCAFQEEGSPKQYSRTIELLMVYENRTNVNSPSPSSRCGSTVTKVRGGSACAGQIIFEDNFDSLKEDVWQIEQFIPVNNPEFPFVSYQRLSSDPTVSVVNGNLRIIPKLQQNLPGFNNESIFSGSLNLFSGCTESSTECSAEAWGASILPPVVSGRVTSKGLAFTYGTVHVRAKLPQGDWLYPDILLEPFLQKYGSLNYASGVLRIASARGNNELNVGVTDFGNKVLYGGPIMDSECRQYLLFEKKLFNGKAWGDDFHVYSINWTPDSITLLVDSEEWARIEPATGGLLDYFPPVCSNLPRHRLATGTNLAPFDDHFYLSLGLAAGGVTEFKDDLYSRGFPKPWRNPARKASLNFWQAMDSWYPTWSNAELLVDYVKVVAL